MDYNLYDHTEQMFIHKSYLKWHKQFLGWTVLIQPSVHPVGKLSSRRNYDWNDKKHGGPGLKYVDRLEWEVWSQRKGCVLNDRMERLSRIIQGLDKAALGYCLLLWIRAFLLLLPFVSSLEELHLQFNINLETQSLLQTPLLTARANIQQNCYMENARNFQPFSSFHLGLSLNHILFSTFSGFQSVVTGPAASVSPKHWSEMLIIRLHPNWSVKKNSGMG